MSAPGIENEVREFMVNTFLVEFGGDVNADTDLFDAGLIDSFGFIELVAHLEQTYGISLSEDDLASPEMATLSGISGLVAGLRAED